MISFYGLKTFACKTAQFCAIEAQYRRDGFARLIEIARVVSMASCGLLCLQSENNSWHSPGRRREFCHHSLER